MKKLRTKSKTIGRIIFGGTLLLMVFGLIVVNQPLGLKAAPKDVKGEVRAEPEPVTDEVTIDEGSSIEYIVPKDAQEKYEMEIANGYVQNNEKMQGLYKERLTVIGTGVHNVMFDAIEDEDGYFYLSLFSQNISDYGNYKRPLQQFGQVYKVDKHGIIQRDFNNRIISMIPATKYYGGGMQAANAYPAYPDNYSNGLKFTKRVGGTIYGSYPGYGNGQKTSLSRSFNFEKDFKNAVVGTINYNPWPATQGASTFTIQLNSGAIVTLGAGNKDNSAKNNFQELHYFSDSGQATGHYQLALKPTRFTGNYYRNTTQFSEGNGFTYGIHSDWNGGSQSYNELYFWKPHAGGGKMPILRVYTDPEIGASGSLSILEEISNKEIVYLQSVNTTRTKILKFDLSKVNDMSYSPELLKTLPAGIKLNIQKQEDKNFDTKYSFYGTSTQNVSIDGHVRVQGTIMGAIDDMEKTNGEEPKVKAVASLNTNGHTSITGMIPLSEENKFFVYGSGLATNLYLPGPGENWPIKQDANLMEKYNGYSGTIEKIMNWAPGIKINEPNKIIDIKAAKKDIEKSLLKGIEVTDIYDLSEKNITNKKTQKWLTSRINRNPKKLVYKTEIGKEEEIDETQSVNIDWEGLGLNFNYAGPQIVKYFTTDATEQVSAVSSWINKKTPQTIIKDDFAIDAQNFTMPLTDVGTLVNDLVKRKAKSMAWNLETHVIDEDTSKDPAVLSNKVTINQGQLAAIQGATVAKPYPLELTYQTANGPIVNKIWVFVTDDQTTVDEDQELVMYGLDHSVAQHLAKDQTNALAIDKDHGSVRVYDLNDAVNKGVAVTDLPPIAGVQADGTVLAGDKIIADVPQLTAIKNATVQQGKDNTEFPLKVTFDNGISVDLTVTVVAKQAELTIKFQDADSKTVYFEADGVTPKADLVYTEIVGDKFLASSIKDRPEVSAVITKVLTEGYPSLNGYDPTEEIEISKDDTTYIFKFNGAVELMKVTPKMTFETGVVWIRDQTLFYESAEDFLLTVRDTRQSTGATEGEKLRGKFSVNAKLATNFIHDTVANAILKDAQIVYFNGTKDVILSLDGGAQEVIKNTASSTDKNFEIMLDDKGQAKNNLRLEIPDSGILEGTYNASIEWDLIQGP